MFIAVSSPLARWARQALPSSGSNFVLGIGGDRVDLAARLRPFLLPVGRLEAGGEQHVRVLVDAAVAGILGGEAEDGLQRLDFLALVAGEHADLAGPPYCLNVTSRSVALSIVSVFFKPPRSKRTSAGSAPSTVSCWLLPWPR